MAVEREYKYQKLFYMQRKYNGNDNATEKRIAALESNIRKMLVETHPSDDEENLFSNDDVILDNSSNSALAHQKSKKQTKRG